MQEPGMMCQCLNETQLPFNVDVDAIRKWAVRPLTLRLLESCIQTAVEIGFYPVEDIPEATAADR